MRASEGIDQDEDEVVKKQKQHSVVLMRMLSLCVIFIIYVCAFYVATEQHEPKQQFRRSLSLLPEEESTVSAEGLSRGEIEEEPPNNIIPLIFLAGQSNMQGFSDQAGIYYSPSSEGLSLKNLLPELRRHSSDRNKFNAIRSVILKVENPNITTATTEASLLLDLEHRYSNIFNDITKPQDHIYCYYESFEAHDISEQDASLPHQARPLNPALIRKQADRCGEPWGLELSLGHTLLPHQNFSLVKLAAGSTNLFQHWSRYYDECIEPNAWSYHVKELLNKKNTSEFNPHCNDNSNHCLWSAIVWFQGSSDAFSMLEAEKYSERLPRFLNHLREEMFHNEKTMYSSFSEIPVVVVGIGRWKSEGEEGQKVLQAQKQFVDFDQHSAFVSTEDLSDNYHFEAASMLIIGDRVARALESLGIHNRDAKYSPQSRRKLNDVEDNVPSAVPAPLPAPASSPFNWKPVTLDDYWEWQPVIPVSPVPQPTLPPFPLFNWDALFSSAESSGSPSFHDSNSPSSSPSNDPTSRPSVTLTPIPTTAPTTHPTSLPTLPLPTLSPTNAPVVCIETSRPSERPGWQLLFFENFEQGWGDYFLPSTQRDVNLSQLNTLGKKSLWSVRIRDDHSFLTTRALDISQYSQIKITFWFYGVSMEQGKGFHLDWDFDDGKGWVDSNRQWKFSQNFDHNQNREWILGQVITPTFGNQQMSLRFVGDGEDNSDKVFLDNVAVKGMP